MFDMKYVIVLINGNHKYKRTQTGTLPMHLHMTFLPEKNRNIVYDQMTMFYELHNTNVNSPPENRAGRGCSIPLA